MWPSQASTVWRRVNIGSWCISPSTQVFLRQTFMPYVTGEPFSGHIKTAEQRIIMQQYSDWYTGHWWVGCYIWYNSQEAPGRAVAQSSPLLGVPNVTAHPSNACVPTSYYLMWHYNNLCTASIRCTIFLYWWLTAQRVKMFLCWISLANILSAASCKKPPNLSSGLLLTD